jgi:Zn finger protein HypA/HybF involved in hydrogenase expression
MRKTWFPIHDLVVRSTRTTTCSGTRTETEDHDPMRCPACGDRDTRVVDSRDLDDSATIRRRRECGACATRFTT